MTSRRRLLTSFGAGLLLAAPAVGALARPRANATCGPSDCDTCGPTGRATAGPFYVRNAPMTTNINLLDAPGTPMQVSGLVLGGTDGQQPLAGVRVELWHADRDGRYHPEDSGDISRYRAEDINLRGQTESDRAGRFAFRSIIPGRYGNRRRHLHWRLVVDGHQSLVTQTYWLDERGTQHERSDPVDRDPEACRWIDFRDGDAGVAGHVVFVLRPAP